MGGLGLVISGAASGGDRRSPQAPTVLTPSLAPLPPIVSPPVAAPACPPEMVLVEGSYCTDVRQDCNRWLDDESLPFARCAEYSHRSRCVGKRVPMRFCIDRLEDTPP